MATFLSLIEVQDILINFQHFSSQEALIGDRTFINFSKISRHGFNFARKTSEQVRSVVKHNVETVKIEQSVFSGWLLEAGCLLELNKFPPQDAYSRQDLY